MWSMLEFIPDPPRIEILDVGASLNDVPSYQPLVDAGRARITGFEPNPEELEKVRTKYGTTHRFFPDFVGDGRPAVFHETNWALTGSLYEPNTALLEKFQNLAELTTPVAVHPVNTSRLDDLPGLGEIDFIKIDVQGSELAVFEGGLKALATAVLIQTEVEFVEMYRRQPMFADVDIFLRRQGFQFHSFPGFGGRAFKPMVANGNINSSFGQMLWSDAWYVRDWMALDKLDADKLRKYAVLVHDVVRAYDLAHLVVTALDRKTGENLAGPYLERLLQGPLTP